MPYSAFFIDIHLLTRINVMDCIVIVAAMIGDMNRKLVAAMSNAMILSFGWCFFGIRVCFSIFDGANRAIKSRLVPFKTRTMFGSNVE